MKNARFLDRTTPPHIITLVVIAGVAALCMNLFLPSLAAMALHFETDYAVMQFAVSGYLAATACLQLLIGPLSDLFGRRPVMLASIAMMIVATLVCMLAPDITVFMFGRVAQAAVVSGFVLARAIVRDMVPMEQAASMIGYVTMGMSVVPMVGPTVGGLLNDISGWQSSFALLALLGVGILVLAWFDLGETNHNRSASFSQQFHAWPELLRSPLFWGYALTSTFSSGMFFSFLGGAPFVGSVLYGLAPAMLGLQFFFMASGYMLGNFVSGRYASQIGITRMMLSGNVVAIAGIVAAIALISTGAESPYAFFVPLALIGVGNGVTLPSANAGMVSVQPHLAGSASGLGGAMTIGGGAALSVLASSVLSKEDGTWPLLLVMLATGLVALLTTYIVRLQEKRQ
ncbi:MULTISPECIES: multidrug effflux MFS transporter [Rhizobium/Agrobacterium group]|jgi:DHA1 family bicyclomycin/chloramphenicol resistance-like MFS transporter|uniref:Bcr/CflA family efflux transporter n=1 Tax=Agrobacterium tumefaciens TaxID=358 RepID=A0AA44JA84_AGRTU|nr:MULTISPECIES: multidrug effflux MFS transporter [Rhizobium/Agrobacterium group]KQY41670.1 multidrug MFS transporter [Rhizobium sp. Root491]MDP9760011.1 DHA1 family bicyclomycin/chloramphenicol resistance-like MFS transporter [Agrobacterium tumefaciens]MDQ1222707.1 DHA1 family bicyclomycin/chloramphenicol resistance-like MFS transporter [Agrobacterium sp. SORGH_AS_0745]MDR5010545.1 multidrug effflux MFS transporter [Agrobacterium tumefaciens]NSL25032.1 multidrug effflux MFS transporter [Agro